MSILRPKPFSVDRDRDFCVDLLNFDHNNSTHKINWFVRQSKETRFEIFHLSTFGLDTIQK